MGGTPRPLGPAGRQPLPLWGLGPRGTSGPEAARTFRARGGPPAGPGRGGGMGMGRKDMGVGGGMGQIHIYVYICVMCIYMCYVYI